jgi:transcriptional regulator with XRE-family HTH domain
MCHVDESTLSGHNGGMEVSDLARVIRENIKRVLVEQGVSQNELSRRTGISQGSIFNLLRGDREIQTDTVQKIADALGVKSTELAVEHEHAA